VKVAGLKKWGRNGRKCCRHTNPGPSQPGETTHGVRGKKKFLIGRGSEGEGTKLEKTINTVA